jgi:hypothetical protein
MAIAARQQRLPMIRPYGAVGSCEPETEAEFVEPTHGGQRTAPAAAAEHVRARLPRATALSRCDAL